MSREELRTQFYIDDHALLFAFMAESAQRLQGDKYLPLLEKVVTLYGRERGARMAMRCLKNGDTPDVKNYVVYGEWSDPKGWSKVEMRSLAPYVFDCTICGWNDSWKKYDVTGLGSLYCRWVDAALAYGFNPELRLEIPKCLSNGDGCCSFAWQGPAFSGQDDFADAMRRKAELPAGTVKDFLYHTGHLYAALRRVFILELGVPAATAILRGGLERYVETFGLDKAQAIQEEARQNFLEI